MEKLRHFTGNGISIFGGILWFVAGAATFVWTLFVLFSVFGAWAVIVGFFLAPVTYIASIFIVWFTTGHFPFLLLIPYAVSIIGIVIIYIGNKVSGTDM